MPAQSDSQYMPAAWGGSLYQELTVPSGGTILAKRLDMLDIVRAGLIEEFDTIGPKVEEKVAGPAQGRKPADRATKKPTKKEAAAAESKALKEAMKDKEQMSTMVTLLAVILPIVIQKPTVVTNLTKVDDKWEPMPYEDREEGVIYIDTVPLGDQMFILSWAMEGMDTEQLEQFREQPESPVGDVEPVAKPASSPV